MVVHRDPVEHPKEPGGRIIERVPARQGSPEPEVRLLHGVIALLGIKSESASEGPELRASLPVESDNDG
jgi:hypothetical protein